MSANVVDISGKDALQDYVSKDGVVLVDFWAEWCGPCRMLGPVLHQIAEDNDAVRIAKVNVDDEANAELSKEYGVRSIPQVTIFKNGEQVDQFVGALPADQIQTYIDKYAA